MKTPTLSALTTLSDFSQGVSSRSFLDEGGIMSTSSSNNTTGQYVLATGEAAAHRLRMLHSLYGPGIRQLLQRAGLKRGMRVADMGCGVATVTRMVAEVVGSDGKIVGVDVSGAQLAKGREHIDAAGLTNITEVHVTGLRTSKSLLLGHRSKFRP
jgi:hypothetical protein